MSHYSPTANQCPDLPDPVRGRVTVNGRNYLDTAEYQCDRGYVLSGDRVRTCGVNGIWGGDAPTCISKWSNIKLWGVNSHDCVFSIGSRPSDVDCGQPPSLQNGQFTLSTGTIGGSRATYTCFRGYRLVGSTTRTCLITGQWSQESISCQSEPQYTSTTLQRISCCTQNLYFTSMTL